MYLLKDCKTKGNPFKEAIKWGEYPKGPLQNGIRLEGRRPYKSKVGPKTVVVNMGTARDCPSKALGLCKVCLQWPDDVFACYGRKPEIGPAKRFVLPFRERQAEYWKTTTDARKLDDFRYLFDGVCSRYEIHYFRLNEVGDFYETKDIYTVGSIAEMLKTEFAVKTFTYTAREDLKEHVSSGLPYVIHGSGFEAQDGITRVWATREEIPKGWYVCPGDCTRCHACKLGIVKKIAFVKH